MKRFKRIYLEITNVCNLSCSFCPSSQRNKKFLNISQFRQIISEISPYTDYIYFHVKGEPLIHPNIGDFLKICQASNIKVNITTNGTLLVKQLDILSTNPSLRQLNISLHSFEENDNLSSFELYIKDILKTVSEIRKNTDCIISFRLWNLEKNSNKSAISKNFYVIRKLEDFYKLTPGYIEKYLSDTKNNPIRGVKLTDKTFLNHDYYFSWPDLDGELIGDSGFCYGLINQCGILSDGTVIPCCLDAEGKIPLGNIFETSFSEIINSQRAMNIVHGFSNRKIVENLCKHCGYRDRF